MLQNLALRPLSRHVVANAPTAVCVRHRSSVVSKDPQLATVNPIPPPSTFLGVDRMDRRAIREAYPRLRRPSRWEVLNNKGAHEKPQIKIYPPLPSARARCRTPIATLHESQIKALDPTGARTRLFSRDNPEAAKVGDIILVRQRSGDPFSGVCMNIRRRGADTAILLRNQLTRVGVEMWYKIYSPNVAGIEVVQRRAKRARRARLYYMRLPKHDLGSVENIVRQYQRQRQALRSGSEAKGRDANANRRGRAKSK